jgi:DNA (cytosine-5)-methyltransferase 1
LIIVGLFDIFQVMNNKTKKLTVADFFCGAGGFSEGFRQKGFDVVFALDNWKPACDTHKLNHPECKCKQMNILDLDTPEKIDNAFDDVDVIIGSPPCVSFSYSNRAGKADKSLGIKLIEAYLRIILWKKSKPNSKLKYWILENVPNSGNYIKKSGYTCKELGLPETGSILKIPVHDEFNASDYGAPQNRKRFLCGDFPVPNPTHSDKKILIKDVFEKLGDPLDKKNAPFEIKDPVNPFSLAKDKLTDHFYDTTVPQFEWKRAKRQKVDHGFMGIMDFPERLNRTCRTVTATLSSSTRESILFGTGKKDVYRLPTIREISCFMGFPINYQFEGLNESTKYKLVGNAVCPPLSAALASAILKEEGLEDPGFIRLKPAQNATVDLTGSKHKQKVQKPKRLDAKYYRHIPSIKIESMRVELTNRESNFEKKRFIWKSRLHHGSGKRAYFTEKYNNDFISGLRKMKGFKEFESKLDELLRNGVRSHYELQKSYCLLNDKNHFTPDELLEKIKKLLDEFYPDNRFRNKKIINAYFEDITKEKIPLKVAIGFYALNKAVDKLA